MNKLTPWQLALLMVCARCFSMMTYFPYTANNTLIFMAGMLISTLMQGILLIPAAVLCKRYDKGICDIALSRNKGLGFFVTAAFLLYFVWDIFITVGNFAYFIDQYFSNHISRIPAVICVCGIAVYLGMMKSSVIGKCGGILFFIFAAFMIVLMLSAIKDPDISNFHLAQNDIAGMLANDVKGEFVRNRELVMLVFLMGDVRGSKKKAVYSYLWVKLVILEAVMGFTTLVLGELASQTDMPLFYLSCFSNSSVVERYDAGFMSVWTVLSVLRISSAFHCSGRCLRYLHNKLSGRVAFAAAGIIPAAATFYLLSQRKWKQIAYIRESPLIIVALIGILPLAVLFSRLRKDAKK